MTGPITPLTNIPNSSDPVDFEARVNAFWNATLPQMIEEYNDSFNELALRNTSASSTTSNTVDVGSKTFTVATGLNFVAGMPVSIADTAAPSANYMYGIVISYSGDILVIDVTYAAGSGAKTDWIIALTALSSFESAKDYVVIGWVSGVNQTNSTGDKIEIYFRGQSQGAAGAYTIYVNDGPKIAITTSVNEYFSFSFKVPADATWRINKSGSDTLANSAIESYQKV